MVMSATELIDVHAHVADAQFAKDLDTVLTRASENGVKAIVAVGETLNEAVTVLDLCRANSSLLYPCVGIHPEHATLDALPEMLRFIEMNQQRLIGVGEIGLDFSPHILGDNADQIKIVQREVFSQQVTLAHRLGLPVNCHSRSAGHYAIEMLKEMQVTKAVLHAFDGKPQYAVEGANHGFYFSVPPSIVRSPQKQNMVRRVPLERLLLETDSPVLGPERGVRNEPANVAVACRAIAELKGLRFEEVARVTAQNARALFSKLP